MFIIKKVLENVVTLEYLESTLDQKLKNLLLNFIRSILKLMFCSIDSLILSFFIVPSRRSWYQITLSVRVLISERALDMLLLVLVSEEI